MSHSSHTLLIGWSPNNVGVDIERSNRPFKAVHLAKRILINKEKKLLENSSPEVIHNLILSKWVAKEALIKWQKGSLYKDLREWEIEAESGKAVHRSLGLKVFVKTIDFLNWKIGVAYDVNIHRNESILCIN